MATIRPQDLSPAGTVSDTAAIIVDGGGAALNKATPAQVVDAAIPLASQAEAEAGTNNAKRVTPLRVKQAIAALGSAKTDFPNTAAIAAAPVSIGKATDLSTGITYFVSGTLEAGGFASDTPGNFWNPQLANTIYTTGGSNIQTTLDKAFLKDAAFITGFSAIASPIGGAGGLITFDAVRDNAVDLMRMNTTHKLGSAGYSLHITDTTETGVTAGGGLGVAISGAGGGNAGVFNRYTDGQGSAILAQRVGSGNGCGITSSFSSTGTGASVYALKQNANGAPGGPSGTGPAIDAVNASEQGESIRSLTTNNNASIVSNMFERQNSTGGIVTDVRLLKGGARTSALIGSRVLLQPDIDSTGASGAIGQEITLSDKVKGAGEKVGLSIANNSSGSGNAYGLSVGVIGASPINYGGYFNVSGSGNNFALYVAAGDIFTLGSVIQAPNLPVHADNAAASATLAVGKFYRTATGDLKVVY